MARALLRCAPMRRLLLVVLVATALASCADETAAPEALEAPARSSGDDDVDAGAAAEESEDAGAADAEAADAATKSVYLQSVLDRLGAECAKHSPGTQCGLAVQDLATGETALFAPKKKFVSASSPKAIWVAAALEAKGVAAVSPEAEAIFARSDDYASGRAVLLLAPRDPVLAANRVNTFMWNDIGMADSAFCTWAYGLKSTNCPRALGADNYFTAADALAFLVKLHDGSLLAATERAALLKWMTLSPRTGWGGWIGTQLPAAVRPRIHHKAGWLSPDVFEGYSVTHEIGIVELGAGQAYAVVTLMNGGSNYYGRQAPMMSYASCVVYHAVTRDVVDPFSACTHP